MDKLFQVQEEEAVAVPLQQDRDKLEVQEQLLQLMEHQQQGLVEEQVDQVQMVMEQAVLAAVDQEKELLVKLEQLEQLTLAVVVEVVEMRMVPQLLLVQRVDLV
jgi:hypothetical protein